jgi:hypothetical protein
MVIVDTTVGVDYLNGVVNAETAWLRTEFLSTADRAD